MRSDKQFSNIFSVCCCLSQKRYCLSQQWKRSLGNQISFRPGPKNLAVPSTPDFLISFLLPLRSPFCCFFPPTTKKKNHFTITTSGDSPFLIPPSLILHLRIKLPKSSSRMQSTLSADQLILFPFLLGPHDLKTPGPPQQSLNTLHFPSPIPLLRLSHTTPLSVKIKPLLTHA